MYFEITNQLNFNYCIDWKNFCLYFFILLKDFSLATVPYIDSICGISSYLFVNFEQLEVQLCYMDISKMLKSMIFPNRNRVVYLLHKTKTYFCQAAYVAKLNLLL